MIRPGLLFDAIEIGCGPAVVLLDLGAKLVASSDVLKAFYTRIERKISILIRAGSFSPQVLHIRPPPS
jgi:hypothetical protein